MQTKLTLRMDDELVAHAKAFAQRNGKSVSQMVADYFKQLPIDERELNSTHTQSTHAKPALPPLTQKLSGCLADLIPAHALHDDHDDRQAYHAHLDDKYKAYFDKDCFDNESGADDSILASP